MKKKDGLHEEYLVKGLVHLTKLGEDINWVDGLYTEKIERYSQLENAVRIMSECQLSRSEISFCADIAEVEVDKILEEIQ